MPEWTALMNESGLYHRYFTLRCECMGNQVWIWTSGVNVGIQMLAVSLFHTP